MVIDSQHNINKLNFIDAIRGYAILGVLLVHSFQTGELINSDLGSMILINGARGVQLFFMASAMTLFYSYHKRRKEEVFQIKKFFARRFFRIAPMFYLAIIYYLFQKFHQGINLFNITHIADIISAFTFTLAMHPYWVNAIVPGGWSIGVEVLFYLTLPMLFVNIRNIQQAFNLFLIAIIARIILQSFFQAYPLIDNLDYWNSFLIYYLPNQFPVFAIGIFLYFLIFEKNKIVAKNFFTISLLLLILLFQFTTKNDIFIPENIYFSLFLAGFIWYLSEFRNRFLVNSLINFIGKISFSIYVVHFAILYWLNYLKVLDLFNNTYLNYLCKFLIVSIISIVIATFFYNLIEAPFQKLGARVITKKKLLINAS